MQHRELIANIRMAANERKQRNYSAAENILNRLLEFEPNNPYVILEQAILYRTMKKNDEALILLETIKNSKLRSNVLKEMGRIYFLLKRYEEAIAVLEILQKENEDDYLIQIDTLNALGNCYNHLKDYAKARYYYELVLEKQFLDSSLEEDRYLTYAKIAKTYAKEGQIDKALTNFTKALEKKTNSTNTTLLNLAEVYYNDHKLQEAEDILNYILENESQKNILNSTRFLLGKVMILKTYETGYEKEVIEQAISLFESLKDTYYGTKAQIELVYFYFKLRDYNQAMAKIKELLTKPLNSKEKHNITQIYHIIKLKLDKESDYSSWDVLNYQNYTTQKLTRRLKSNQQYSTTHVNGSINQLIEDISLNSSNYYGSNIYDEYYVSLPDVAVIDSVPTDFILVKTLVNSPTLIVDIIPCRSLNNELQKKPIETISLNIHN